MDFGLAPNRQAKMSTGEPRYLGLFHSLVIEVELGTSQELAVTHAADNKQDWHYSTPSSGLRDSFAHLGTEMELGRLQDRNWFRAPSFSSMAEKR